MQLTDSNTALKNLSALVDFSNLINSSLDLEFALNNIILTCFGKFHTSKGIIALTDDDNVLRIKSFKGIPEKSLVDFPELNSDELHDCKTLNDFMGKNKLVLCREILSSNRVIGALILGERLTKKSFQQNDLEFLETILSIGATAIENSLSLNKLKKVNRSLDAKVNQLSSLFDLSKEFSGILETEMVGKLLVYSIIGQMMISKFAVVTCGESKKCEILETKIPKEILLQILSTYELTNINDVIEQQQIMQNFPQIAKLGFELIVPMKIKGKSKGLILLGKRINKQSYSRSDIEYLLSVGSLAIISIENSKLFAEMVEKRKIEKDLELAKNIQKNLLPRRLPTLENFEIAALNETAKQVGGDYYDVVKLDEDNFLFAIGDVSGKGVQAALMMANLQAFLKSVCKQKISLDEGTNLINDLVSENTLMGNFITFFWGIINSKNKLLTFVNAGHNPPLLISGDKVRKLKKGGMILGVMETITPYEATNVLLEAGDVIVLFTDGITEAMNNKGIDYSDERLEQIVFQNRMKSAEDILNILRTDVAAFTEGEEQSDDITAMILKVK